MGIVHDEMGFVLMGGKVPYPMTHERSLSLPHWKRLAEWPSS